MCRTPAYARYARRSARGIHDSRASIHRSSSYRASSMRSRKPKPSSICEDARVELVALWIAGAFAIAAIVIVVRWTGPRARIALLLAMIAAGAAFARPTRAKERLRGPRVTDDGGYVGSGACRACHPSEHASWSRTYHRTMTQRGTGNIAITTGSHHMQGYWTEDEH